MNKISKISFEIQAKDPETQARMGLLTLGKHKISTPVFMPVGTKGSVKGVFQHELKKLGASILLANTYHLSLRPGMDILRAAGGLHKFMGWSDALLTDSGGYQVFSLKERRVLDEGGVCFQSHIDGSRHIFTPSSVIDHQRIIGSDILMPLDECPPAGTPLSYQKKALHRTHTWWAQSQKHFKETTNLSNHSQVLFPILQGGPHKILRREAADTMMSYAPEGYALGGLSVGEPKEDIYKVASWMGEWLPSEKPRYLMGLGRPEDLLESISMGMDMFDCVIPTREGRTGRLFTSQGILNIKNKKWEKDFNCIDPNLPNSSIGKTYQKAYLRHLFMTHEMLGAQIASLHNLSFYFWLMQTARHHIQQQSFRTWKKQIQATLAARI
ncbi:MAG: tRNA guanosine(34) transglycosylase Tgt [Cytophagales bacterium]|nr:tRNA guanosine(34) transglycosylase Tgt [Cytophagales bacterium]